MPSARHPAAVPKGTVSLGRKAKVVGEGSGGGRVCRKEFFFHPALLQPSQGRSGVLPGLPASLAGAVLGGRWRNQGRPQSVISTGGSLAEELPQGECARSWLATGLTGRYLCPRPGVSDSAAWPQTPEVPQCCRPGFWGCDWGAPVRGRGVCNLKRLRKKKKKERGKKIKKVPAFKPRQVPPFCPLCLPPSTPPSLSPAERAL